MDQSTSMFYNSSLGSIHPALKKNEKCGFVVSTDEVKNGRAKKRYSITKMGREQFKNWISESMPAANIKDEAMLRLFFLGNLEIEKRDKIIEKFIKQIEDELEKLSIKKSSYDDLVIPKGLEDIAKFQMATLQFGIDYFKFVKKWYNDNIA
jgi:DNA-binding PadR family transcriptional regulator